MGATSPRARHLAARLAAVGRIEIERVITPEPSAGEALVRVGLAGVCGTDLALWRGALPADLPLILGHEMVGTVSAIGPGVSLDLQGRRVAAEINITCQSLGRDPGCAACQRGIPTHCLARRTFGIHRADGAFQSFALLPARNLHIVPDNISDEEAVFVEPLAAALQTFCLAPLAPGDRVAVLGCGRLGLLIIAAARDAGAQVTALDRDTGREQWALAFGAHEFQPITGEKAPVPGTLGFDCAVEATGSPDGAASALSLVRPRGRLCLKSTTGRSAALDLTRLAVDEIQVSGSRCGSFAEALRFIRRVRPPLASAVSSRHPLAALAEALEAASQPGKVLIEIQ
jgi:threonine dehydrogenase-like Zn-dependent dehydrogenase